MSLSPETRDSLIVGVSIVLLTPALSYTLYVLAWCAEGVLRQRIREERTRLAAFESPEAEAEPEGTGDDVAWRSHRGPCEGSKHHRSTSADEASGEPPFAGE